MRWLAKSADSSQIDSLAGALRLKNSVIARLLVMRGMTDPGEPFQFGRVKAEKIRLVGGLDN